MAPTHLRFVCPPRGCLSEDRSEVPRPRGDHGGIGTAATFGNLDSVKQFPGSVVCAKLSCYIVLGSRNHIFNDFNLDFDYLGRSSHPVLSVEQPLGRD